MLASLGCEVTAVDLRGHGNSPSAASYALDELAADVAALTGRWRLVIGHSMGGPVASIIGATGRCERLLLLDPLFEIAEVDFEAVLAEQLAELDAADVDVVRALHPEWHVEDCRQKAIAVGLTSDHTIEACLRDNRPFLHRELLDLIKVETLILGSDPESGSLFPPETMSRIDNPLVSYRMVAGCGHSIQREQPYQVIRAARELLTVI